MPRAHQQKGGFQLSFGAPQRVPGTVAYLKGYSKIQSLLIRWLETSSSLYKCGAVFLAPKVSLRSEGDHLLQYKNPEQTARHDLQGLPWPGKDKSVYDAPQDWLLLLQGVASDNLECWSPGAPGQNIKDRLVSEMKSSHKARPTNQKQYFLPEVSTPQPASQTWPTTCWFCFVSTKFHWNLATCICLHTVCGCLNTKILLC